jgi:hypothetical protein
MRVQLSAHLRQRPPIGRTVGGIAKIGKGLIGKWWQHGSLLYVVMAWL